MSCSRTRQKRRALEDEKVVPDQATLEDAYRRTVAIEYLNNRAKEFTDEALAAAERAPVPDDLAEAVRAALAADRSRTWDEAIAFHVAGADKPHGHR